MVKKVITKKITAEQETQKPEAKKKRICIFCQTKTLPTFTDSVSLRRFLNDRSRILPRTRSNLCSRHQRRVTREIKYARHLALLPFTPKV